MHVYELAIQLGKRSTELTELAEQLGMGHLIAASPLTPEQRDRLTEHITGMPVPPAVGQVAAAPAPVAAGPRGDRPRPKAAVVAAVAAVGVLLLGGAYVLVSGQRDELTRHVDAEAAADARGEIPDDEPPADDPPDAPAGAPDASVGSDAEPGDETTTTAAISTDPHVALCSAAQKIVDLDAEGDVLNTDRPSWAQVVWAFDQIEATLPELAVAYGELRAAVPPELQGDVDAVRIGTEEITRQLAAVETPEQFTPVMDGVEARTMQFKDALFRLDDHVQAECGLTLAD